MAKPVQPPADPGAFLRALQDPGRNLKNKYKGKPLELAERLGLKFPEKPAQVMRRMGIYDEEYFGPITPGLRELVLDTCLGDVHSAAALGPRGGGKHLHTETPVPTDKGWKAMGDLRVGDTLYDRDGEPCRVTKVYPIYRNKECYRIFFGDGSSIICSGTHPWLTQTQLERAANLMHAKKEEQGLLYDGRTQWKGLRESQRTTEEIAVTLHTGPRGDLEHSVDNTLPVEFSKKKLPIDPYLLGIWLGDGHSNCGMISVGKDDANELETRLRRRGHTTYCTLDNNGNFRLRVEGLTTVLRISNLLDNKHVPGIYLRASISQRRWLLAGLMDSDGTVRNYNNNCQFDNTNEKLADAVYELVVSLGWKATRSKRTALLYGIDCGIVHKVSFRPTSRVFRNYRKHSLMNFDVAQKTRHLRRMITNVMPTVSVPVRCIEVDSPSHTYLVGEQMVPTHNSMGVSFVEFYLWIIEDFDALNLGGSELQASNVYDYLISYLESDKYWLSLLKGEPKISESSTIMDAWIRVLTASSKSVRSPHAGGWKRRTKRWAGGLLVIDEEAECDPEIVAASLYTINTARPSVNIRASTFHNAEGSFATLIDNHKTMGFKLYQWDAFDVCAGCDCTGGPRDCQSPEPCFREDHYEEILNPDTGKLEKTLKHKAYCGGKSKFSNGWIPMQEIINVWTRSKRNHAKFEVEAMGSRPTTSGYVIKDRKSYALNVTEASPASLYLPGAPISIVVDWGSVAAGLSVWQEQPGDRHILLHAELVEEAGTTEIIGKIITLWNKYLNEVVEVAADIGGGGNYNNPTLREEHGLIVRDVNFAEQKEAAVAAWNIYNEAQKLAYPAEFLDFHNQVKNWKRKNGRIVKGNDHIMDSCICYFAKFIDRLGLSHIRVLPRTYSSAPTVNTPVDVSVRQVTTGAPGRVAIARGLRSSRRRR